MLHDRRHVFINGEAWRAAGADAALLRHLADHRRPEAGELAARRSRPRAAAVLVQAGWALLVEVRMNEETSSAAPAHLPSRRFEGREDFRQLVRDALATAAREGWRELILSDASFEDWPLGERAVAESLGALVRQRPAHAVAGQALRRGDPPACALRAVAWQVVAHHHGHRLPRGRSARPAQCDLESGVGAGAARRGASHGWCGSEPDRRVALRETLNEWLLEVDTGLSCFHA